MFNNADTRASRSMPSEAKACSKISTLVGIFFSERETPRALACAKRRMLNNAGTKKNQNGVPIKQAGAGIIFTEVAIPPKISPRFLMHPTKIRAEKFLRAGLTFGNFTSRVKFL